MKRFQRPFAVALATALAGAGLAVVTAAPASAAVLGSITINPLTGTDSTLFSGSLGAACPAGTVDSYYAIFGDAFLGVDGGFLGQGSPTGIGPQTFTGASIANLKTTSAGSFGSSGVYQIRFNCVTTSGILDTYTTTLNYVSGGLGSWSIVVPPRATATVLTATPAGSFELGTLTTLAANVTPTTGADNPTGFVEFFRSTGGGAPVSLGIDNTLTATGIADLVGVPLPQGSNAVTAVFTPAAAANLTGSTSAPVTVSVTPVADRPTTAALTVTPLSGPAFQPVTLTCTVSAGAFNAAGTANFVDGTMPLGSVPVVAGAPAILTTSSLGAGTRNLGCSFVGTAPYTNSTSNVVLANYVNVGAVPDEQTVTVVIPVGVLSITTPYTPANPLALGTALLDPTTATYSASTQFGTAADPDGAGPLTVGQGFITISDTRAGNLGFTASVLAGPFSNGTSSFPGIHAGLTGLTKLQVTGNALQAADVTVTNTPPFAPGLGVPRVFANYPAGKPIGTANLTGMFGVDKIPTSVSPGTYTSTVTFTAV